VKLVVVGAGGHAKVVVDAARAAGHTVLAAEGDTGGADDVLGVPVVQPLSQLPADSFIIAIGDNAARKSQFEAHVAAGMRPVAVVHPSAIIGENVTVGEGAFIAAGAVVNPDARIGPNVILNTGCTVDHDCAIGAHAHIAPGVALSGGVSVGEGALIGVGAAAVPGAEVGAWAIVGAGATIIDPVPDGATAVGTPARIRESE
jgi:sugar O-acyltransferase (sialic acid O-acetyltransferase NeuD family)